MKRTIIFFVILMTMGLMFFSCSAGGSGSSSGGSNTTTTDSYAHVRFQRTGGSGTYIIINLYTSNTASATRVNMSLTGANPSSTSSYVTVDPGTYYVGWTLTLVFSSTSYKYEAGKYYTAALNAGETDATVTVDK
jgi:hypothetical protein